MIYCKQKTTQKHIFWAQELIWLGLIAMAFSMPGCSAKKMSEIKTQIANNLVTGINQELRTANLDDSAKTKIINLSAGSKCVPSVLVVSSPMDSRNIETSSNIKIEIKMSDINEMVSYYMTDRLKKSNVEINPDSNKTVNIFLDKAGLYGFIGYSANVVLRVSVPSNGYDKTFDRTIKSGHFSKPIEVAFSAAIHRTVQDVIEDVDFQNIIQCKE